MVRTVAARRLCSGVRLALGFGMIALGATCAMAQSSPPVAKAKSAPTTPTQSAAATPGNEWIARSDAHAQVLLQAFARYNPEFASQMGVEGVDDMVMDLGPRIYERSQAAIDEAVTALQKLLKDEKDARVRQDLEILIEQAGKYKQRGNVEHELLVPYLDVALVVFMGERALLDDQVDASRRPAALVRLRRYAGLEKGYEPITKLAMDRTRERLGDPKLLGPIKDEVEQSLGTGSRYVGGIEKLFQKYEIKGYEEAYAKLQKDMTEYEAAVRKEVLPRARTDFKQPPQLYALSLSDAGIDMPVDELVSRAEASFTEIRSEMQALAIRVAKEKGYSVTDYRDVLRELRKKQIVGEAILPHYQARIRDMEAIIEREHIVTLPKREMRVRLASEAESAAIPAPNMRPPRMIGNTGEMGEFVLPLRIPNPKGDAELQFDDFTYEAASWTLTAHEGRPGHELQFAANVEHGVSLARSLFAMNSTNAEGWGLYAEAEMKPYEPLDGQLVALQHRLLRAARAFLDPGLQMGTTTREEASRILRQDVVLSEAMANQEVERYTYRAPGQAPSYFCGYSRLLALRTEVERALGADFDRQRYHDFVLAQGLLPVGLLRKAVLEEFVPAERSLATRRRASGY